MSDERDEREDRSYTIATVAQVFLDQEPGWFRYKIREDHVLTEGGTEIGSRRANTRGDRLFTIDDVEQVIESLHRHGILNKTNRLKALRRVKAQRERIEVSTPVKQVA